jgi:cytoskeletal protein CcmA (bactofilin family)
MCLIKYMFKNIGKNKEANLNHSGRSYIGETLQIEGDLRSSGTVDVAGLINGNVFVSEMIVKETGSIRGHTEANLIEINGHIEGKITATNIIIGKNAIIKGDIYFKNTLKTEEGADIDGYIKRINNGKLKTDEDIAIDEIIDRKDNVIEPKIIPGRTHKEAV